MTVTATTDGGYAAGSPHCPARAVPTRPGMRRVRVWDLPTRLFHWVLVACVAGLAVTGYTGGAAMPWHARLGYAVLALLLFRAAWGFVGGRWSRFSSFLYSPASVIAYLRGRGDNGRRAGHNPLGALSVFAMLAVLLLQVATGLVSDDEIGFTGPLNRFVQASQGLWATWYHKEVGQWAIATLVVLHLGAVAYYVVRRKDNLVRPMLDGDKDVPAEVHASRDDARSRTLAAAVFALCCVLVAWMTGLG